MGEKRKYMRFDIIMDAICRTSGVLKKLKINNFSAGGIGFVGEDPVDSGDNVEVEMHIPGDNIPVVFQGEIMWLRDYGRRDVPCEGGVRFNTIKDDDKNRILEYIYKNWIKPTEDKVQNETEEK